MKTIKKEQTKNDKVMPIKKFRAGNVTATIWKNTIEKDSKKIDFFNATIERSYKQTTGEWTVTNQYARMDLIKLQTVLQESIKYLYLNEEEQEEEN